MSLIAPPSTNPRNSNTLLFAVFTTASILGGVCLMKMRAGDTLLPILEKSAKSPIVAVLSGSSLTKDQLAEFLGSSASFYRFPTEMEVPTSPTEKTRAVMQYSFDHSLQEQMEGLFQSYSPDYGSFVAIDPSTGRILSMVSYSRGEVLKDNLALRATFPSASVFKVVTAAAAIESNKFSGRTIIPFNGANHTLYKGNALSMRSTRWTRHITLKEAFAKSVNTVFARIGAFTVGASQLRTYADRFGFNRKIASDLPIQQGRAPIPNDSWGISQAASGFTRENTMSPLQGAMIAAAIANDGVAMDPYVVDSIYNREGGMIYQAQQKVAVQAVDPATAEEIRGLMRATVQNGTGRHAFRGFFKKEYAQLDVGGKTGSLTGLNPQGKYDWFVGYARLPGTNRRIAVAALTIHRKLWRVKSAYLARKAFENYFQKPAKGEKQSRVVYARPGR